MLSKTVSTANSALVCDPVLATTSLIMSSLITYGSRVRCQDRCLKLLMLWEIVRLCQTEHRTVNPIGAIKRSGDCVIFKAGEEAAFRGSLNCPITKLPNYSMTYRPPPSSSLNMYLMAGL